MEMAKGIEPMIEDLQSTALPLGDTIKKTFCDTINFIVYLNALNAKFFNDSI